MIYHYLTVRCLLSNKKELVRYIKLRINVIGAFISARLDESLVD